MTTNASALTPAEQEIAREQISGYYDDAIGQYERDITQARAQLAAAEANFIGANLARSRWLEQGQIAEPCAEPKLVASDPADPDHQWLIREITRTAARRLERIREDRVLRNRQPDDTDREAARTAEHQVYLLLRWLADQGWDVPDPEWVRQ